MKMNVQVRCPICSQTDEIQISKKELGKASRGLLSISLPENVVCNHSFIVYVDRNFKVRDYFVPDFEINLRGLSSTSYRADSEKPAKSSTQTDVKEKSKRGKVIPEFPEDCNAGDIIEQAYNNDTILSYIFSLNQDKDRNELYSFSILLNKDQNIELYKLVVQEFIECLKENGLLAEDTFKKNQKLIYTSFNDATDLEINDILIPLSDIFKQKKKELKKLRRQELKGSFF